MCNEAALIAARSGKSTVQLADFEAAVDRVIGGLEKKNKVLPPAAFGKGLTYRSEDVETESF